MKINNEFGKLLQDGSLQYAPESFNYNGKDYIHPTPAEFKMVGMLPIVTVQPSQPAPSGYHYEPDGLEADENEIRNKWKLVKDPPSPPRVFSKLKVVEALKASNLFDQVKQWVIDNGMYDLYLAAQVFAEDNQYFEQGLQTLKTQLQLTDEQVEQILEACVVEG